MDEVTLSKDATDGCMKACDAFIDGANVLITQVHEGRRGDGFGTLDSGRALGQKFAGLYIGEPYSLSSVLQQHIEIITKLKAAFEAAGQRYIETDTQNAAHLTAQQPK